MSATVSCVRIFTARSGRLCWWQCRSRPLAQTRPHVRVRERRRPRKQNASRPFKSRAIRCGRSTSAGSIRIARNTISPIVRTRGLTSSTPKPSSSSGPSGALSASCSTAPSTAVNNNHLRAGWRYVPWPLALRRRRRQHAQGDRSQCAARKRYQADPSAPAERRGSTKWL